MQIHPFLVKAIHDTISDAESLIGDLNSNYGADELETMCQRLRRAREVLSELIRSEEI